jgi:hypothetical protein
MSETQIEFLASQGAFRPRQHFSQLAEDHVPFDELVGRANFESRALQAVIADDTAVGVLGPRGGGKSSLISYVCAQLPDTHVALRVPVTGADDPTDVSTLAAVALSQALDDLDLERYQREALERARADQTMVERTRNAVRGGTLGGGPIPAQLHGELGTLREQLTTGRLAADRLAGLDRLITILVARELQPVFVLEDTEAAVGGADRAGVATAFMSGPLHAFVHELEAPCLIAVQSAFQGSEAYRQLVASLRLVEIPALDEAHTVTGFDKIVSNRLRQYEIAEPADSFISQEALTLLIAFYDETERNLRFTLAALQSAAEYAAEMRAARIAAGHVRAAATDWRARLAP